MEIKKIIEEIKRDIAEFKPKKESRKIGVVAEAKDGIAAISGLGECLASEMILFPQETWGLALNLEEDSIGAVIIGSHKHIKEGDVVKSSGRILEVPAGEAMIGRVVDALGRPLDGRGAIETGKTMPVEKIAPGVITRRSVRKPLQTGIKVIDSAIPIGRGQRELIIGDRQTGKTALAIDAIINQKGAGVVCVYCAVGQKDSKVAKIAAVLDKHGALEHTIIVNAPSSASPALQYLAPYSAAAIGEYFMEKGGDALVVYDDLTKHAQAYRQISLLLRRPPGREAYPGDVFYIHSRLLERAACLNDDFGGGTLTALPIIETQAGDVSAYIPTNVISITDGQIYLDTDLFYSGVRPAVNVGLSVSRVGSSAQTKAMKSIAGGMRLQLAQYRELAAFMQFEADLDKATRDILERGKRLTEILKQEQYEPMPLAHQVLSVYAVVSGAADDVRVSQMKKFEKDLIRYVSAVDPGLLEKIGSGVEISGEIEERLKKLIAERKFET